MKIDINTIKIEKRIGISSLSITGLGNVDTISIVHRNLKLFYLEKPLPIAPEITFTKYLKSDARIGLNYFKPYDLIINSTTKEYILSNPKKMAVEGFIKKSYGIRLYKVKDTYKIILIKPNENLPSTIKLMGEVSFIDNKAASLFNDFCNFETYLEEKKTKNESLFIKLKGSNKTIEIPYKKPSLKLAL